jgi:hypothetical protein
MTNSLSREGLGRVLQRFIAAGCHCFDIHFQAHEGLTGQHTRRAIFCRRLTRHSIRFARRQTWDSMR